jgi:outer membrane lipoprotein SlyB
MDEITPTPKRLHPLLAMAAAAVIVVSVLGAIVLITNQVSAHRGESLSPATGGDANTPGTTAGTMPPAPPRGTPPGIPPDLVAAPAPPAPACNDCGVVAGVRVVKTPGQGTGVGAVAGGVVGGLVGHEFGSGHGKSAMSILGVVGGAVAGHEVEKEVRATKRYEVDVRLDNGQLRTVGLPGDPGPIVGMRVRVENGRLIRDSQG